MCPRPHGRLLCVVMLSGLLACTPDSQGQWQGELASYVVDRGGGRAEIEHHLRDADGSTLRRLSFAGGVAAPPAGSRLRVWGAESAHTIEVHRHEVEREPPLPIAGMPKPTRKWAFVLLDIDGGGNAIDKMNAQSVLFSAGRPDSIRSYFREVSYGTQDLEGEVMGPIAYQMEGRCDTDRLARALVPQIGTQYDQYLWFFGKQQAACNWAGIAELGRADRPTRHSWFNSFHSCTVLVQEPGHNFGMVHSSAMRCTLGGRRVPIAWPEQMGANCEHREYGNPFDPMGGGDCFHMNGVQKAYQDWLAGCNVIRVTESGTFTLYPLEPSCDGPQLLQIPFPQPRMIASNVRLTSYYLELRAPIGYRDQRLTPQVLVMVANDVREARFTGNNNWLLDMTPETDKLGDEGLPAGRPFEDGLPNGPKFTVLSVDATKAVIQVELQGRPAEPNRPGKAVCDDGVEFQPSAAVRCTPPPTPAGPPPPPPPGTADAGTPSPPPPADASRAPDAAPATGGGGVGGAQEDAGPAGPAPVNPGPDAASVPPPGTAPPTATPGGSAGGCKCDAGAGSSVASVAWPLPLLLVVAVRRIRNRRRPASSCR